MQTVRIEQEMEAFVIHFGGEFKRINAYTLASTLFNIADAAKAANATINPGYEIEIVVEALGSGSFRTKIRAIYSKASNLFSGESAKTIILSILASFIYQHTLAPDQPINVNVSADEVVVVQGDKRIVVPRSIHEAQQLVEKSPQFRKGISQAFKVLQEDLKVTTIGIARENDDRRPPFEIPREHFAYLPESIDKAEAGTRELVEITDVEILRAILEKSKKKRWAFVWNGMRIAAPVTDIRFYDDFFAHRITVAPGDALRVKLRIKQVRAEDIGIYINEAYEVIEVLKHIPRAKQLSL